MDIKELLGTSDIASELPVHPPQSEAFIEYK
jgi:hypothetical protein